ncbi:MAG: DNA polymerase/3'-5' exonuclease PolX [Steroidobacteraceae bacterium]
MMTIHNEDVAEAFDEMADLLAIQGANPFRIRAYRRGAQVIRSLSRDVADFAGAEEFDALPGIGADLAGKIVELRKTGRLRALEELRREVPPGLRELLKLPGLGPVRVRTLRMKLRIRGVSDLKRAVASGRLEGLKGFGAGIASRLAGALAGTAPRGRRRMPWPIAAQHAQSLRAYLQALPGVTRVAIAGSYRRGRDTVGDLDLLVCAPAGVDPIAALKRYDDLRDLSAAGATKASGVLRNGLQFDVRVVPAESYGAALYYFTGSRDHSIRIRRRAQEHGYKLNEYGLFRGRKRVAGATEEELLAALGLPWIPAELREDRGEIEAAEDNTLPVLIERADLQGDLHVHTDASDGHESLEKVVAAARAQRLRYVAITDHAKYLGVVHGLDAARLARQIDRIDALNERLRDVVVLKGAEVDILEDGKLALPDTILSRLDLVVVAIHSQFGMPEARQTTRILRALERPCVSILAHPTGRLLGERPPYVIDFDRVLRAARDRPCYLEINGQPNRLDLDDVHAKAARELGVLLSIASDAHSGAELAYLEHGIRQARRGWATKKDVLNSRPLKDLRTLLRRTMH